MGNRIHQRMKNERSNNVLLDFIFPETTKAIKSSDNQVKLAAKAGLTKKQRDNVLRALDGERDIATAQNIRSRTVQRSIAEGLEKIRKHLNLDDGYKETM